MALLQKKDVNKRTTKHSTVKEEPMFAINKHIKHKFRSHLHIYERRRSVFFCFSITLCHSNDMWWKLANDIFALVFIYISIVKNKHAEDIKMLFLAIFWDKTKLFHRFLHINYYDYDDNATTMKTTTLDNENVPK